jgi:adenine-specific DNA-methyltransferase
MPLLHWLTRDADIHAATHAPYRLLEETPDLSHGDRNTGNMLIQGDNLDALKALLPYYAGEVKCIFIDPPYNTKSAFEHYDDNLEHTKWLAMMYPRLELLRDFLAEDGSIWVTIDDNEAHYLKVIMDEVFGRKNFVASMVWENFYGRSNAAAISPAHNYILLYSPMGQDWKNVRNLLPRSEESASKYKNPDKNPRGSWRLGPIFANGERHEGLMYTITTPSGRQVSPPKGSHWRMVESQFWQMVAEGRIVFGSKGDNNPAVKLFLSEVQSGLVPRTWWAHTDVGHTQEAKREIQTLFSNDALFDTPKPERLLQQVLQIATNPGELVLDSFLGSATTAAVAHKMGRRYIGIEMGDHAQTHCAPRLQKVIEGEQGGISEAVGWTGGGGFRFYQLGVPVFDESGHIAEGIRFAPLAAHLWFVSTGTPFSGSADSPFLGSHEGVGYYLLYNGILGDKRPNGGNILTGKVLASLPAHDGAKVIFGEGCRLSAERLTRENITFRQIPYEIKAR